ncbi:MAG: hypothetical protein NT166_32165 [Candidatus Aminicenantes bacterium]|nr:hypothetical protein [Candidatus Aminicenantes bacterium]
MRRFIPIFSITILIAAAITIDAATWKKYTTASSSFHYPAGWEVKEQDSNIEISNTKTKEQLLIVAVPFDKTKSPLLLAKQMVTLFKQGIPDIKASGFRENGQSVYFESTYSEQGTAYRAEVLLVKGKENAHWFSYSAPSADYKQEYGLELLQAFMSSIATGNSSQPPENVSVNPIASTPPSSLEKNARSFLFVLEFALGAPLNHTQEKMILDQLLAGWKAQSRDSLKKFDAYPQLAALILSSGQHELEKLRSELEKSTRQWLAESDQNDPVVSIVRSQLQQRSKILAADSPPLTEMAATAYSEMTAFADILAENSNASPADISSNQVDNIRRLLQKSWGKFTAAERSDVLTTPGLWLTFRTLLQFGGAAEKEKIRGQLLKLAPATNYPGSGKSSKPMSMVEHNVLMNINRATFNSYLWSRGFKTTTFGY